MPGEQASFGVCGPQQQQAAQELLAMDCGQLQYQLGGGKGDISDWYCDNIGLGCPLVAGTSCTDSCRANHFCGKSTQVCIGHQNAKCTDDKHCFSLNCEDGKCASMPKPSAGTGWAGDACNPDYEARAQCERADCDATQRVCLGYILSPCRGDPFCRSGRCDPVTQTCVEGTKLPGAPCVPTSGDCSKGSCDPVSKTCIGHEGAPCSSPAHCQTRNCDLQLGQCAGPTVAPGGACTARECDNGYCGDHNTCIGFLGASCFDPSQCQSLACDPMQNICVRGAKTSGATCEVHEECALGLRCDQFTERCT